MIKHFFTALLFPSIILIACSCKDKAAVDVNATRFEQLTHNAHLEAKNVRYLIWNSSSCGGCRSISVNLMRSNKTLGNTILIVPLVYANQAFGIKKDRLFVDSSGIFDKLYFGIDNIGIANVEDGKVINIRNYNPDAMDSLKVDIGR